jgi:hypothetical protein
VGLADACFDATATVVRVLTWFASQSKDRTQSGTLTLQMAAQYLQNCSLPTTLSSALLNASSGTPPARSPALAAPVLSPTARPTRMLPPQTARPLFTRI